MIPRSVLALAAALAAMPAPAARAAGAVEGAVEKQGLNITAVVIFFVFVLVTLGLTYPAARPTQSASVDRSRVIPWRA